MWGWGVGFVPSSITGVVRGKVSNGMESTVCVAPLRVQKGRRKAKVFGGLTLPSVVHP